MMCLLDIKRAGAALLQDGLGGLMSKGEATGVFNSLPWERLEVLQIQDGPSKHGLGMFDTIPHQCYFYLFIDFHCVSYVHFRLLHKSSGESS